MLFTVFTPTYNRAYTLTRCYESLKRQTYKHIEWVIVDDGSTDNTRDLVQSWINSNELQIKYLWQPNSGKHVAHNKGVDASSGLLFTCLDSDDWLTDYAVEHIVNHWRLQKTSGVAGIIALDAYANGSLVGTCWPEDIKRASAFDILYKYRVLGDKVYVFLTEVLRRFPFPVQTAEGHMPPSYQIMLISLEYDLLLLPSILKYVEYLDDGITRNLKKKYLLAPNNYAEYRILMMKLSNRLKDRLRHAIHYVSSCLLARRKNFILRTENKIITVLALPFGLMLYYYLRIWEKRNL